jgi:hypothetical protein
MSEPQGLLGGLLPYLAECATSREMDDATRHRVIVSIADHEGVSLEEAANVLWYFEHYATSEYETVH